MKIRTSSDFYDTITPLLSVCENDPRFWGSLLGMAVLVAPTRDECSTKGSFAVISCGGRYFSVVLDWFSGGEGTYSLLGGSMMDWLRSLLVSSEFRCAAADDSVILHSSSFIEGYSTTILTFLA